MTVPLWEAFVLGGAALSGPLAGYLLGRLHERFIQEKKDRERAFSALGGKADWELRADEAEQAAIEHTKKGYSANATMAMEIALQIRQAHKADR